MTGARAPGLAVSGRGTPREERRVPSGTTSPCCRRATATTPTQVSAFRRRIFLAHAVRVDADGPGITRPTRLLDLCNYLAPMWLRCLEFLSLRLKIQCAVSRKTKRIFSSWLVLVAEISQLLTFCRTKHSTLLGSHTVCWPFARFTYSFETLKSIVFPLQKMPSY